MEDQEWEEIEEDEEQLEEDEESTDDAMNLVEEAAEGGHFVEVQTGDGRVVYVPARLLRALFRGELGESSGDEESTAESEPEEVEKQTLEGSELEAQMRFESGLTATPQSRNFATVYNRHIEGGPRSVSEHQGRYRGTSGRPLEDRTHRYFSSQYIPNKRQAIARYNSNIFCAEYSQDGDMLVTAAQDMKIRIYDSSTWKLQKRIHTHEMGWAVLCTDFSPNAQWVAYSGWDTNVHLVNTSGDHEIHEALGVADDRGGHLALFSVKFSSDSRELLAGSNDQHVYLYDIETKQRTHRIPAHSDDINNVAWADASSQVFFTGSDDRLIKVWDRREAAQGSARAAGVFIGHSQGITYIDSRNDGRYLISNGKDQHIKLWDLRQVAENDASIPRSRGHYDYRYGLPTRRRASPKLEGDSSIMTYSGHSVAQTLIRCKFSPFHSTGQRYIYTGSYGGSVVIYDVLTGEMVKRLKGHAETVRDLDWHPYKDSLVTTGWDGVVLEWTWNSLADAEEAHPVARAAAPRRRFGRFVPADDEDDPDFNPEED